MTKPNQPEETLRDAHLKASIWRNESEKGVYHTTTLARTYEDKDGKLKDTQSFSKNDLLKVAELARSAYGRINELQRDRSQSPSQEHEEGAQQAFREKRQAQSSDPQRSAPSRDY